MQDTVKFVNDESLENGFSYASPETNKKIENRLRAFDAQAKELKQLLKEICTSVKTSIAYDYSTGIEMCAEHDPEFQRYKDLKSFLDKEEVKKIMEG